MKKLKRVIPIIIAFIIGISTTVTAATVFNSKDITYSSSATTKTNVKDSLDELYTKAAKIGECPEGNLCRESLTKNVQLGDYISMTPTSKSYTISSSLTGFTSDQPLTPSDLNLWRVISKNSDGTIDVISEYLSYQNVLFKGDTGYLNLVGALNTIAAQYTNTKYVIKTRHVGYSGQLEKCTALSSCTTGSAVGGYETDLELVGSLKSTTPGGEWRAYWLAARYCGERLCGGYYVSGDGVLSNDRNFTNVDGGGTAQYKHSVRPILTLKSNIGISGGEGTKSSPYRLA